MAVGIVPLFGVVDCDTDPEVECVCVDMCDDDPGCVLVEDPPCYDRD